MEIFVMPEEITIRNERVSITFFRHFTDDPTMPTRCISQTDIPRVFDAINAMERLSTLPPGNEHRGNPSGENTVAADLAALETDDEAQTENGRKRVRSR